MASLGVSAQVAPECHAASVGGYHVDGGRSVVARYLYDRGEHRKKHCWNEPRADFRRSGRHLVGKCPNTITDEVAQALLDHAIAEPSPFGSHADCHPERLYAVHEGVIYEASPTLPGASYHGYPWRRRPGRRRLPREILDVLRARAEAQGHLRAFEQWMEDHG